MEQLGDMMVESSLNKGIKEGLMAESPLPPPIDARLILIANAVTTGDKRKARFQLKWLRKDLAMMVTKGSRSDG